MLHVNSDLILHRDTPVMRNGRLNMENLHVCTTNTK